MSDLEKLFEHAPEGADSLKQSVTNKGNVQWFKGASVHMRDDEFAPTIDSHWKTIVTRPIEKKKTIPSINWDLAPEGAETLEQSVKTVTWCKEGYWWAVKEGWKEKLFPKNWQIISTRPKTKTVADAYEAFPNGWLGSANSEYNFLSYFKKMGWFFSDTGGFQDVVCNREEYEAYAKEQEGKQEGEKWTHVIHGDKCRIKVEEVDCDGYLVVLTESDGYHFCTPDELKPLNQRLPLKSMNYLLKRLTST